MNEGDIAHLFSAFPGSTKAEWIEKARKDLKGKPLESLDWTSGDAITIHPFYTKEDLPETAYLKTLQNELLSEDPGYGPRKWENRVEVRVENEKSANQEALKALENGADGLIFRLETNPDWKVLLHEIGLTYCGVSLACADASIVRSYLEFAQKDTEKLQGAWIYDGHNAVLQKGKEDPSYGKELFQLLKDFPTTGFQFLHISGEVFANSGALTLNEMAGTLLKWSDWLDKGTENGLPATQLLKSTHFELSLGRNYFFDMAKIRAFRYLAEKIAKAYVPEYEEPLFISASTCHWVTNIFDPFVNMLRNTTSAMAGILGGAQALHIAPHSAAYEKPTDFAKRIARNISLILRDESYLDKVADPMAGSYYLESLTDELSQKAWGKFLDWENAGGFEAVVQSQALQKAITKDREQQHQDIVNRKEIFVGTNQYPNPGEVLEFKDIDFPSQQNDPKLLIPQRATEALDKVRWRTEKHVLQKDEAKRPTALLVLWGNDAMAKARSQFAQNMLGCAGIKVVDEIIFHDLNEMKTKWPDIKADFLVACASDEVYLENGEAWAKALRAENGYTILAGNPENKEALQTAGIQHFIHRKSPLLEDLNSLLDIAEIPSL